MIPLESPHLPLSASPCHHIFLSALSPSPSSPLVTGNWVKYYDEQRLLFSSSTTTPLF